MTLAIDLPDLAKTRGVRRSRIVLRPIAATKAQAQSLYAAAYRDVVDLWAAAVPRIAEAYARTLSEMVTDSPAEVEGEISAAQSAFERLILFLTPLLSGWVVQIEKYQRGKWAGAVLTATGIDLSTILSPRDVSATVEAALRWNSSLIRDVSDQVRKRVSDAVFAGMQRRAPPREIAAELREAVGMARRRSLLIASDQSQKLMAGLDQARQEQAGITRFMWRHSGKLHPREHHVARNGKVYPWKGNGLGGDLPGVAPYCGCRAQAVIDLD